MVFFPTQAAPKTLSWVQVSTSLRALLAILLAIQAVAQPLKIDVSAPLFLHQKWRHNSHTPSPKWDKNGDKKYNFELASRQPNGGPTMNVGKCTISHTNSIFGSFLVSTTHWLLAVIPWSFDLMKQNSEIFLSPNGDKNISRRNSYIYVGVSIYSWPAGAR